MSKLYFYTKTGCPLCDKGLEILQKINERSTFEIVERDIYSNDEWLEKYQIRIPVIEDETGDVLDEGIISSLTLKQKINKKFTC
ncbi:glutaredoxin family protein [Evansella cellulosilytica]|uniref:Glutaredoxin 2 n=1 Tax=Evansella cellulosilytica (strain ATCC 21833 / DSM 2522 / FERM P-1141 / JCM 9156 / N-4) TaxID=649639 RepID=E6TRD3_EVAC2|nr:glutaredoxin family protein [Evansella cellulosilytica]ADU31763.1 glutaredoxin 2 [Evansella cellulosilytica DSM 2522]